MLSDLGPTLTTIVQLCGAILLALPTAYNRERSSRLIGLRTFPLVALGSCAYVLLGQTLIFAESADSMARIMQGLMTGIGFVGGGAILKSDDRVKGTASAASIWITGASGAAVGLQEWGLAITLSVLNFLVMVCLGFLKAEVETICEDGG